MTAWINISKNASEQVDSIYERRVQAKQPILLYKYNIVQLLLELISSILYDLTESET